MKSFTEILEAYSKLSKEDTASLKKKILIKSIPKGTLLQRQGDLNSNVYYVKKGLLRSYSIDEKGKEHIFLFAPEGWTMADGESHEKPTDLFIETLEDCELEILNKRILVNEFTSATNASEVERSKSLLRRIAVMQKRIIMLMSASALERYEHFTKMYPQILQRVPQKMIASYLGITPEALSKVKNQRVNK